MITWVATTRATSPWDVVQLPTRSSWHTTWCWSGGGVRKSLTSAADWRASQGRGSPRGAYHGHTLDISGAAIDHHYFGDCIELAVGRAGAVVHGHAPTSCRGVFGDRERTSQSGCGYPLLLGRRTRGRGRRTCRDDRSGDSDVVGPYVECVHAARGLEDVLGMAR